MNKRTFSRVCGVDCLPEWDHCNRYCQGEADAPETYEAWPQNLTVRQVFEIAYGKIDPKASCHPCIAVRRPESVTQIAITPCVATDTQVLAPLGCLEWEEMNQWTTASGPDISDRPASSFVGFFGHEFDEIVAEAGKPE